MSFANSSPTDETLYRDGPTISAVIARLAGERPIFHSEADLQHHLALSLRAADPGLDVRLETRPLVGERLALDMLLRHRPSGDRVAVELKYPVRSIVTAVGDEKFSLRNQAAQDLARYDVVKDITRIEHLVDAELVDHGWVLLLTNDSGLWTESTRTTVDAAFRLHHGRTMTGALDWAGAGAGTMHKRESTLTLTRTYQLGWQDYVTLPQTAGRFRLLAVHVRRVNDAVDDEIPQVRPAPTLERPVERTSTSSHAASGPAQVARLEAMIDELRRQRESCEPKTSSNARYLRYSNAVSSLLWLVRDLRQESGTS